MIYLIESPAMRYISDGTREFFTLYKIGYADVIEKRLPAYKLHNPTHEVLYIYEGSKDNEQALHYKFRDFKYREYGREWFYDSPEILDYFSSIPDFSELDRTEQQLKRYKRGVYEVVVQVFNAKRKLDPAGWFGNYIKDTTDYIIDNLLEPWGYLEGIESPRVIEEARGMEFTSFEDLCLEFFRPGLTLPVRAIKEKLAYFHVLSGNQGKVPGPDILREWFNLIPHSFPSTSESGKRTVLKGYRILPK